MSVEAENTPVAVVTGAAGGIGSAVASCLGRDGFRLALVDWPGAALDDLAARLQEEGYQAAAFASDVRDSADTSHCAEAVLETFGRMDALVTCAGIGRIDPITQTPDDVWHDTLATNLTGTFWWSREAVAHMRERGGVIVMVSSVTALVGLPGRGAYSAAKAGVIGLARTLAIECAGEGIRVIAVCPGATRTGLVQQGYDRSPDPQAAQRAHAALQPIGRLSEPEEIAETIAFACSPRAATITGATLIVDGGYTAGGPSWNT